MNKKGYLKILESVLAIIIVLAFVLTVLPKKDVNQIKVDPELESTADSIAKQIQNNPTFRDCALKTPNKDAAECIYTQAIPLVKPLGATWQYGVRICTINTPDCGYSYTNNNNHINNNIQTHYNNFLKTIKSDLYTKNIIIEVPDISNAPTSADNTVSKKEIRLLFWSKQ